VDPLVAPQTDFTFYGKEYAFSLPKFPVKLAQISTILYYKKVKEQDFLGLLSQPMSYFIRNLM
jgi:hypothetical protein